MLPQKNHESDLEFWLKKSHMTINEFAELVGCHRETIRKIKQGGPVESRVARTVYFITNGFVNPLVRDKGSGKRKQIPHPRIS